MRGPSSLRPPKVVLSVYLYVSLWIIGCVYVRNCSHFMHFVKKTVFFLNLHWNFDGTLIKEWESSLADFILVVQHIYYLPPCNEDISNTMLRTDTLQVRRYSHTYISKNQNMVLWRPRLRARSIGKLRNKSGSVCMHACMHAWWQTTTDAVPSLKEMRLQKPSTPAACNSFCVC